MKRLIILLIIAAVGWYGYGKYHDRLAAQPMGKAEAQGTRLPAQASANLESTGAAAFKCDGRTHCSQMTSCAEATYFLRNCPGTKMDGNNDGVPCERQWCK